MQVTRIIAVRHGETAWNRDTRIQGHTDIPLNARGQWQAQQLGLSLSEEAFAACYASDLSRASATAQAVAAHHRLPVARHLGLRERCFGEFEGQTWKELESRFPEETLAWRKRVPDFAPPGGESLLQLQARVVAAVTEIAAKHPGEQVLIVSDPLHMRRAMAMAAAEGFNARPAPTPTSRYRSLATQIPFLAREVWFMHVHWLAGM